MEALNNEVLGCFANGAMESVNLRDLTQGERGNLKEAVLRDNNKLVLVFGDLSGSHGESGGTLTWKPLSPESRILDLDRYIIIPIAPHAEDQGYRLQLLPKDPNGTNILLHPADGLKFNPSPADSH